MSGNSVPEDTLQKPHDHYQTDLFLWHQYQGDNTNDCAAFSIAIMGNAFLNRSQFEGFKVAREMEKVTLVTSPLPHLTLRKIPQWATLPWGVSGYLQSQHIPAKLNWFASVDHLLRNIREGRLTIVILGDLLKGWGHAKVVYGYEPPAPATAGPGVSSSVPTSLGGASSGPETGPQPQQGFYFVDPGYPKEYSRPLQPLGVFWQDENEFKQQWNSLFRILIEITA
jgi:hypothetical protein